MENKTFALKGNIIYAKDSKELCINEQSYLVCENGKVYGIYSKLPEDMKDIPVEDVGDKLSIPGLTDPVSYTHLDVYKRQDQAYLGSDEHFI